MTTTFGQKPCIKGIDICPGNAFDFYRAKFRYKVSIEDASIPRNRRRLKRNSTFSKPLFSNYSKCLFEAGAFVGRAFLLRYRLKSGKEKFFFSFLISRRKYRSLDRLSINFALAVPPFPSSIFSFPYVFTVSRQTRDLLTRIKTLYN